MHNRGCQAWRAKLTKSPWVHGSHEPITLGIEAGCFQCSGPVECRTSNGRCAHPQRTNLSFRARSTDIHSRNSAQIREQLGHWNWQVFRFSMNFLTRFVHQLWNARKVTWVTSTYNNQSGQNAACCPCLVTYNVELCQKNEVWAAELRKQNFEQRWNSVVSVEEFHLWISAVKKNEKILRHVDWFDTKPLVFGAKMSKSELEDPTSGPFWLTVSFVSLVGNAVSNVRPASWCGRSHCFLPCFFASFLCFFVAPIILSYRFCLLL